MSEETMETKNNYTSVVIGAIVVLVLLFGAAFVAGRLLSAPAETDTAVPELPPELAFAEAAGDGERQVFMMPEIIPASEIPSRGADEQGLYVRRTDDTITIGTGNVRAMITDSGEAPDFSYDGIEVDILITNQTELFEDITEITFGNTDAIQQEIRPLDNLDDLNTTMTLQVWGRQEGDRIVADTIVVINPPIPNLPPR